MRAALALSSLLTTAYCLLFISLSPSVEPHAELVVDGVHVRLAPREEARLGQEHGQAARLKAQAVGGALEDGGRLRVEPLLDAVADGALRRGREAGRPPRVVDLDGVVEDVDARPDAGQRKVSVDERIRQRLHERPSVVVRARRHGRLRGRVRARLARTLLPEVAVALDKAHGRLEERVEVSNQLD